jgi:CBS domain-containing protein
MNDVMRIGASILAQFFWINVFLVVFNMLPAFPMDGGRVLRALLAMRMDYVRATQIAATIGQAMAIVFAFIGLFSNAFLMFIALFVWLGAAQEASMVQMRSALRGIPVMRVMVTNFQTLGGDDRLSKAADYILGGFQQDFPVVDDGQVVGVLTRGDLIGALSQRGPDALVREAMQREFATTDPREMLERAFERLQECQCHTLPVVRDGRLLGLLTGDNVTEALMIQQALRDLASRRDGWTPRVGSAPDAMPRDLSRA